MTLEALPEAYSEAGLAGRDPEKTYYTSVDVVRRAKSQILDLIFDNPGQPLPDSFDEDVFEIVTQLKPVGTGVDIEDDFWGLVKGLEADGELVIEPRGEAYFPILTEQSIGRLVNLRRKPIEDLARDWQEELAKSQP